MARHAKSAQSNYREVDMGNVIYGVYDYFYVNGVDANRDAESYRERRRGYTCIWENRKKKENSISGLYEHEYIWVKNSTVK